MRRLLVSVALFALLYSTAIAGPKEDALQVLEDSIDPSRSPIWAITSRLDL